MDKNSVLNQLDLAFVIDTTGSMGHLISDAQRLMVGILKSISKGISLQVAVVEYKDHCDGTAVRAYPFTADLEKVQRAINRLAASGGGDAPEAVMDGLVAAANLDWRENAVRQAILIGDAPPHGRHPDWRCQCGKLDFQMAVSALEGANITLHSIALTGSSEVRPFDYLARFTGGHVFCTEEYRRDTSGRVEIAANPIAAVKSLLERALADIEQDGTVLEAWNSLTAGGGVPTLDDLRDQVSLTRPQISASLSRLGRRGLIASPIQPVEV